MTCAAIAGPEMAVSALWWYFASFDSFSTNSYCTLFVYSTILMVIPSSDIVLANWLRERILFPVVIRRSHHRRYTRGRLGGWRILLRRLFPKLDGVTGDDETNPC